jgi:hypothetical protein
MQTIASGKLSEKVDVGLEIAVEQPPKSHVVIA